MNDEAIDDDLELLDEESSAKLPKYIFFFIALVAIITFLGILYYFLKNSEDPIKIQEVQKSNIVEKKFIPPMMKEKPLPKLPSFASIKETIKPKPKKIEYIPEILKGEGTLSINDGNSPSVKQNTMVGKKEKKSISNKVFTKKEDQPYTGGVHSVAGVHHYDPNLFLPRGTFIPCSMDVRLISMVSGQISCTVSDDIYSANGNVLLLERGSTAIGTYKKTALKNGMNRIYVIWEDLRTPNNVIVSVKSGSTDEIGSAGVVGEVDNHWGQRLSGAILLSVIDDAINASSQRINGGGFTLNNTSNASEGMAEIMLRKFIDIPPTLYKSQGDLIHIYLNKDIDFSKVYDLEME